MSKPIYKFMCNCMKKGCGLKAEYMISDPDFDVSNPPFHTKKPLLYLCEKHTVEDKKDLEKYIIGFKITSLRMIELGFEGGW